MWAQACELLERAERMHREFATLGEDTVSGGPVWEPPADIAESEEELTILVALPGVLPDHIEIDIDDEGLTIAGERRLTLPAGNSVIHRLEIPNGRFERRLNLDMSHLALSGQELANGCLHLSFRKHL
jgi:HSP20 family molecular chaperone IbpA